ncbi:sulfur carrier protein ThiS [Macrococcoides caseolyticum]|uniref:Sulfur carrier protein ThiS n=1 Tax=Macrococcus psychrotolerans TaxID=3039389 RepID=A0AAU6R9U8_9STAP|nr:MULTISPECIES: sulfur carrier protein ThiS [Macrococcus]MBQ5152660.1 sulfur carrier protein ThiS [Macrococcus caseolyticus]MDJ1089308.1 sulfur carrier protein ThiS [Macrococcus caseolyticus]MDJ1091475.1 sulfur carrier protein ThiS [Macrococcus caseolyticus]MDJ1111763.1 sulfur carrier protein ThiS [Macrococcus sp. S115]QYA32986.1 sulfur carrier protein ThiS [Macrococcus sp. 19Msa1099]
MKLYLNDELYETQETMLVPFLETLNIDLKRAVIVIDDMPVQKDKWDETEIRPEQRLELLEFVGGG